MRHVPFALVALVLASCLSTGCNDYRVRFLYPREQNANQFNERPERALFVSEPVDLRPDVERQGRGRFATLHFPSDEKLDQPASVIVRRALMQDLLQTRVAALVQNPDNADYVVESQLLSMTNKLSRPASAWFVPVATGALVGLIASDGDTSHGIKVGLVGAMLGTFIPAPAKSSATVEVRLSLTDRVTGEQVWSTVCEGTYEKRITLSLSAREDKKIAEAFLPRALKKANACAVGQLYAFFQDIPTQPAVGK